MAKYFRCMYENNLSEKTTKYIHARVTHIWGMYFQVGQSKSDTVLNSEFKYHTHSYRSLLFKENMSSKIRGYYENFIWICPHF